MDHRSLDVVRLAPAPLCRGPLALAFLAMAPAGAIHVDVTKVRGRVPPIGADEVEPCADL
jgi:hypothetical protein